MFFQRADQLKSINQNWKNSARFKKGDKNDINNCRGVSQHTMASRILARLLTDRLRAWAETFGPLNENQNGTSRFTADATQIKTKIQEDTDNLNKGRGETGKKQEDPEGRLLDLRKAYMHQSYQSGTVGNVTPL